jgi:hypothetical protein
MMIEDNDLSAIEFRVYCQLLARTNGDRDYCPFGEAYLAEKMGIQPRTWIKAAESLEDRGMIRIHREGQHRKHFQVLWSPQLVTRPADSLPKMEHTGFLVTRY